VSIRPGSLASHPDFLQLLEHLGAPWERGWEAVLRTLGLQPRGVRRMTLIATELGAWPMSSLILLHLEDGQDARALSGVGQAAGFTLADVPCRRLPTADWPHPMAIINRSTIVTGPEAILRHLAGRSQLQLASPAMERLLKTLNSDAEVLFVLDLKAAREARWRMPTNLMDIWPAGKVSWRAIWALPVGIGVRCDWTSGLSGEAILVCEDGSAVGTVLAAGRQLVSAAKTVLGERLAALPKSLEEGELRAEEAVQYEVLLNRGLAALDNARWEEKPDLVCLRLALPDMPATLATAALKSETAVRNDWHGAAVRADEAQHHRLLRGLVGYRKAEGGFPTGVLGDSLLPPETRLSWIAAMLPYYGHGDWYFRLQRGYSWNSPQNRPVTSQPLPEVINPVLGPVLTDAGFPVTHYVGVAGVGEDAGREGADPSRAGVFGYVRGTRLEDIIDGASNTIAILGVSDRLGAWGAGGHATVRPLTKPPYVNGPDGFGAGMPHGMLAGMADGSVRFISKDVEPRIIEQLATIRGGENVSLLALGPKPGQKPLQPDSKTPKAQPSDTLPHHTTPGQTLPGHPGLTTAEDTTGAPPSVPRPQEDILLRLATPILALELSEVPLNLAVNTVGALGNVPVALDCDALADLEVSVTDPVDVRLTDTTVGKALETVAAARGLACLVEGGLVIVTTPPAYREQLRVREHDVADLVGADPAALAELAAVVQRFVAPESWQSNGGRGKLKAAGTLLVVEQPQVVQQRLRVFLERFRAARAAAREPARPAEANFAPRWRRARDMLERRMTVNFRQPTSLREILVCLAEAARGEIVVDWRGLTATGVSPETKASITANNLPLASLLKTLLEPLALDYRVVDADVLEVSSRKTIASRLEIEFHPLTTAPPEHASAELVERLKSEVGAASWHESGGPGMVYFDKPARCLIVLQSPPLQVAVARLLAGLQTTDH
jgi:hypothetical protein